MRLEPGMALQPLNIAIKACQEVQREPQIDDGRGWAFRTSRFFAGRGLLTTRRWGARVGATGPSPGCRHAVFPLRNGSDLPHLVSAIYPIFVVYSRYPRAYARGTWDLKPEIQLYFARVDFLLKLNISLDDVFVDPDRGGEKTNGPKLVPPVYLLAPGETRANFPTRVGFALANDGRHGILGGHHDHQMHMIDLDAQGLDCNVRMKPLHVE